MALCWICSNVDINEFRDFRFGVMVAMLFVHTVRQTIDTDDDHSDLGFIFKKWIHRRIDIRSLFIL